METIVKKKVQPQVLEQLQVKEERQVILHCEQIITSSILPLLRVWPTTYLLDTNEQRIAELVHAENITLMPEWKPYYGNLARFTLYFTALPKDANVFRLQEYCGQQDGAMESDFIQRNSTDIYQIQVF